MSENVKCRILQGTYCALLCIALSFNTYYLEAAGFSYKMIGIFVSVSCAAGCILQAVAGRLADLKHAFVWKNQLIVMGIIQIAVSAILITEPGRILSCILYILMMIVVLPMMPMINRASFYYTERGIPVDFGIARGIGSMAFSAMSFAAGRFTVLWGSRMVPVLACVSALLFLATTISMPLMDAPTRERSEKEEPSSVKGLFKKYPTFMLSVFGIFLMFLFHNGVNTYMIRIVRNVGGDSGSMGLALGIAAAAELPVLFLYGRLMKTGKFRNITLVHVSGGLFVLRGILYILAPNVYVIYFIQLLQGLTFGLLIAAKANYANEVMSPEDQSSGQSLVAMTESLGIVCASLLGGFLIDDMGVNAMIIVFTVAAALGTLITIIDIRKK